MAPGIGQLVQAEYIMTGSGLALSGTGVFKKMKKAGRMVRDGANSIGTKEDRRAVSHAVADRAVSMIGSGPMKKIRKATRMVKDGANSIGTKEDRRAVSHAVANRAVSMIGGSHRTKLATAMAN